MANLALIRDREQYERPGEIVRAQHDRNHPYLLVQKKLIHDKEISFELRGFLCFILAQPTNWHSRVDVLAREAGIAKSTCYKYLAKLAQARYIERTIIPRRDVHGHYQSVAFYTVFEEKRAAASEPYREVWRSANGKGAGVPDDQIPF